MNKITVHCIDGQLEYEFLIARLFTVKYSKKLRPKSIHTPKAGKIIFEGKGIITSIIAMQPLIKVNSRGDIIVYTSSTKDELVLKESYSHEKEDIKDLKRDLKLLNSQFKLGLSIKELFEMNMNQAKYEASILEKRKENIYKGGGF